MKDLNPQNATMQKGEGRIPRSPRFEAFVIRMPLTARRKSKWVTI